MKTNSKIALISAITAAVMLTSCSNNITAPTASASPDSKSTTSSANIFVPYTENDSSTEDSIAQDTAVVPPASDFKPDSKSTTNSANVSVPDTGNNSSTEDSTAQDTAVVPPASDFKYEYDAVLEGITIRAYTGTESSIRIPTEIDGDPVIAFLGEEYTEVTWLGTGYQVTGNVLNKAVTHLEFEEGFTYISGISGENVESVVIPEGVIAIGSFGEKVKSISLPSTLKYIDDSTFYNCSELSEINLPSNLVSIGYNAFAFCTSLKEITIPGSVTKVGDSAFYGCENLTTVKFEDDNQDASEIYFDIRTFKDCENLKQIVLPDNITAIPKEAFYNCVALRELVIPDGVTKIGDKAFYNCNALTAVYHNIEYNYLNFYELYTDD